MQCDWKVDDKTCLLLSYEVEEDEDDDGIDIIVTRIKDKYTM